MAEELAEDKHAGTTHVTIPIHGPEVTPDTVMEFLKDHMKDATSTIFHLDVAPTVSYSQSAIHISSVPLNSGYLLFNSRECMGVNEEALQLCAFIKSCIFYFKSRENPHQYYKSRENLFQVLQVTRCVWMCNEIKRLYDKIIITIVPSYTEKNITPFVAVGIVTRAAHL